MPRPPRRESIGDFYYVRSHRPVNKKLFWTSLDYQIFLAAIDESARLSGVQLVAYCLVPQRYELALKTPKDCLSSFIRHLHAVYGLRWNRKHNRKGKLFYGRYHSALVEKGPSLYELIQYIHYLPVRMNLCRNSKEYEWSSAQAYISQRKQNLNCLNSQLAFHELGKSRNEAQMNRPPSQNFISQVEARRRPCILGSREFKDYVKKASANKLVKIVPLEQHRLHEQILEKISRLTKTPKEKICRPTDRRSCQARRLAIYSYRHELGWPLQRIAEKFHLSNIQTISRVVNHKRFSKTDHHLYKELKKKISSKSQSLTP